MFFDLLFSASTLLKLRKKYVCLRLPDRLGLFFLENLQTIIADLFKNFYVSLGTTTSCTCLLKSQRFALSVPFNVTDMV